MTNRIFFQAYPFMNITNIVEYSHEVSISDWCREEGSPCKWTHSVRPYHCIGKLIWQDYPDIWRDKILWVFDKLVFSLAANQSSIMHFWRWTWFRFQSIFGREENWHVLFCKRGIENGTGIKPQIRNNQFNTHMITLQTESSTQKLFKSRMTASSRMLTPATNATNTSTGRTKLASSAQPRRPRRTKPWSSDLSQFSSHALLTCSLVSNSSAALTTVSQGWMLPSRHQSLSHYVN